LAVVVVVTILTGTFGQLPTGLGLLAASFGASVGGSAVLSVLAPYALPENTNPFAMNSGGGSAKGLFAFLGLIVTLAISTPIVVAAFLFSGLPLGPYAVLLIGVAYGSVIAWLGTIIAGSVLDRRGPEILIAITPRR
jgi:ABC-2 type transport system permease protein